MFYQAGFPSFTQSIKNNTYSFIYFRTGFNNQNKSGFPKRYHYVNTKLEVRKIPRDLNNITRLNEHFSKFGTIVNIQVKGIISTPHGNLDICSWFDKKPQMCDVNSCSGGVWWRPRGSVDPVHKERRGQEGHIQHTGGSQQPVYLRLLAP